ncbi:MAG: helix-turn-helix domain-containing protein [Pseudomonadota bacterium]
MAYDEGHSRIATNQAEPETAGALDTCGMAQAVGVIGDRWTLLIIRAALMGNTRFDAIKQELGLPRSVLSDRLKKLTEAGVLKKRRYQLPGQRARHQYVLTPRGVDLALPLIALMKWGEKHLLDGETGGGIVSRQTGAPLNIGLVDEHGEAVRIEEAQFRLSL